MDLLIAPLICLALTVYHEARGEPVLGQIAVIQVVQNRVKSNKFPNDICSVITQPGQFAWVLDNIPNEPKQPGDWAYSVLLAHVYMEHKAKDITHNALFYHALPDNHPHKGKALLKIGNHIFWR